MDAHQKRMGLLNDVQSLKKISGKNKWTDTWDMEAALLQHGKVVLVTDSLLHIVFASSNILLMNGYLPKDVVGKTPRLFQGKNTSAATKQVVRKAIIKMQPFTVSLLNYRKNGSVYNCGIEAFPVFNNRKEHINYIAFEKILANDH